MRATRWAECRRHAMGRPGTSEASWRGWPALREFPAVHLAGITSAVVITAHPGDAVLSVGGTISMLTASGAHVRMVSVNSGDVADPGKRDTPWEWLGEVRHALQMLGADGAEIVQLRGVAASNGDDMDRQAEAFASVCAGFDLCLAPWEGDRHPAHESVARAAQQATAALDIPMLSCPVWLWHWAHPEDPRVPWERMNRIVLSEEIRRLKVDAIACLNVWSSTSRFAADGVTFSTEKVAHFIRDAELVFR